MSDPNAQPPEDAVRYTRTFVTDGGLAGRLIRSQLAFGPFGKARLVLRSILVVVSLAVGVLYAVTAGTGWPVLAGFVIALVLAFPLLLLWVAQSQSVHKHIPTGSIYSIELRDHSMSAQTPRGPIEAAYRSFDRCLRSGAVVLLRNRITWASHLLPVELFTDESYEYLLSRVQPAKASTAAKPDE